MNDLHNEYPDALKVTDLTRDHDRFRSWLVCHEGEDPSDPSYNFTVMGDLMPLYGIEDAFEPVDGYEGLFGHYVVEIELDKVYEHPDIKFESEGMTFFAYAETYEAAAKFMDDLKTITKDAQSVVRKDV